MVDKISARGVDGAPRWRSGLLVVVFLLAGCGGESTDVTTDPSDTLESTSPMVHSVPESVVDGAVEVVDAEFSIVPGKDQASLVVLVKNTSAEYIARGAKVSISLTDDEDIEIRMKNKYGMTHDLDSIVQFIMPGQTVAHAMTVDVERTDIDDIHVEQREAAKEWYEADSEGAKAVSCSPKADDISVVTGGEAAATIDFTVDSDCPDGFSAYYEIVIRDQDGAVVGAETIDGDLAKTQHLRYSYPLPKNLKNPQADVYIDYYH